MVGIRRYNHGGANAIRPFFVSTSLQIYKSTSPQVLKITCCLVVLLSRCLVVSSLLSFCPKKKGLTVSRVSEVSGICFFCRKSKVYKSTSNSLSCCLVVFFICDYITLLGFFKLEFLFLASYQPPDVFAVSSYDKYCHC